MTKPSYPQTSLFRNQPSLTSYSMFVNNFRSSLSYFSSFVVGQFVCHSLSALLQKLICNLFALDQKLVLDQVVPQISSVLFSQCSAPLLCFILSMCVCMCVCVCVCACVHVWWCWGLSPYSIVEVWQVPSMIEQTMLTHRGHLLMDMVETAQNSQLGGGFQSLG